MEECVSLEGYFYLIQIHSQYTDGDSDNAVVFTRHDPSQISALLSLAGFCGDGTSQVQPTDHR